MTIPQEGLVTVTLAPAGANAGGNLPPLSFGDGLLPASAGDGFKPRFERVNGNQLVFTLRTISDIQEGNYTATMVMRDDTPESVVSEQVVVLTCTVFKRVRPQRPSRCRDAVRLAGMPAAWDLGVAVARRGGDLSQAE